MSCFTTIETFFVVPLNCSDGEIQKINFLLQFLEKSGVGKLIEQIGYKSSVLGIKSYNPYKLFTSIIRKIHRLVSLMNATGCSSSCSF